MIGFNIKDALLDTGIEPVDVREIQKIVKERLVKQLSQFADLSSRALKAIDDISNEHHYSIEFRKQKIAEKESELHSNLATNFDNVIEIIEVLKGKTHIKYTNEQLEIYYKNLSTINVIGTDTMPKLMEIVRAALAKNDILLAKLLIRKIEEDPNRITEALELRKQYEDTESGRMEHGVEQIEELIMANKFTLLNPGNIGTKNGAVWLLNLIRMVQNEVGLRTEVVIQSDN